MPAFKNKLFADILASSSLAGSNADYLEQLYEDYLHAPEAVPKQWQEYFDQFSASSDADGWAPPVSLSTVREEVIQHTLHPTNTSVEIQNEAVSTVNKQVHVLQLINAYRFMGHRAAQFNPLARNDIADIAELQLSDHGLSMSDYDTEFNTGSLFYDEKASLREIVAVLKKTYCGSVGAEYMHITETTEKRWIQHYLESAQGMPEFDTDTKQNIMRQLVAAENFERYCHRKYVGQKRFSLEGSESLIPLLNELIHRSGSQAVEEITIGMAHRGRLNVLVNVMGKTPAELFMEFEGKSTSSFNGTGDVKYHKGFSADIQTSDKVVHVALAFNPSHLEIVSPVVEGSARARQERRKDADGNKVIPILIHGDAAFAGQGVVMETFNMSQSRGFSTKGTVHLVINNQIGFTTSNQADARSTLYCTDVAKMVSAPIFHVNSDDPEAVCFIAQLALDYRMTFYKDVVIDLVCYRRHGHSESDEPMATQPVMYRNIRSMPTVLTRYALQLESEKVIGSETVQAMIQSYLNRVKEGRSVVKELVPAHQAHYPYDEDWTPYQMRAGTLSVDTQVDEATLRGLYQQIRELPQGFTLHPNVEKVMRIREMMISGQQEVDWGFAETMAYATLLNDGYAVRLSGQDSGRGTFFHRHAVLHNQSDGSAYVPLRNLKQNKNNFLVINSLLSEEAVLAFEYGYATTDPHTLTIWEAQFGDFANTAQVVIDQFISAGEQKWNRMCGLVMLLPHGFEGQGPEHSSARLERYLQLCAQQNIQVCVPTTAAQIFHLLRKQMLQTCRKPLIVMTPKSLLRHKQASSTLQELTQGGFQKVISSEVGVDAERVTRVILCSGKVYYDLLLRAQQDGYDDVAIIRVEQLYPFPDVEVQAGINRYSNATQYVWCQEEPQNQGAWYTCQHHLNKSIAANFSFQYAGRPSLAAPAVGLLSLHNEQLQQLIDTAFGVNEQTRE